MSQKVAFFDLDGTFFRWQLYHELVFELKDRNVFDHQTAHHLEAALVAWQSKQLSWHDYEMKVIKALEPALESLETHLYEKAAEAVISRSGHKIYNYTNRLLNTLKQEGYYTLAISGSQQEIAEAFAQKYGFDECIGALYERKDGKFTGSVVRYVPGRKHEIIQEFLGSHPELTLENSVAVGDSEGDSSMLEMVSRPIAFNPSSGLFKQAEHAGWEIVIERKNMAYTLKKDDNGHLVLAKTDIF